MIVLNKRRGRAAVLNGCIIFFTLVLFLPACGTSSRGIKEESAVLNDAGLRGKALAQVWCGSCHQEADPSLLSKDQWVGKVLPAMGLRLGIHSQAAIDMIAEEEYADTTIFPRKPLITSSQWNDITQYFQQAAPDSLPQQPPHQTARANPYLFTSSFFFNDRAGVCMVKVDTLQQPRQVVFSDAFNNVYRLNDQIQLLGAARVPGPVVDMSWTGQQKLYTNIGTIDPSIQKKGNVGSFIVADNRAPAFSILFDSLSRPVQTIPADLDKNGKMDYVICEFGMYRGGVSWMQQTPDKKFKKNSLIPLPGAIKAVVADANQDGWPDIWALIAQGDEGLYLLINKGDGTFENRRVLRFPPVYGSMNFEVNDFNNDGYPDILYVCGDNADFTPVLKPYHGIYIYTNDKSNRFTQDYFYPMYGAYKAMAADFDGDKNMDVAAIAFFADFKNHPQDGFVFLKNKGGYEFESFLIPETEKGRWLCMDVADFDGDKKPDIILGNMPVPLQGDKNSNGWLNTAAILVLKNKM